MSALGCNPTSYGEPKVGNCYI